MHTYSHEQSVAAVHTALGLLGHVEPFPVSAASQARPFDKSVAVHSLLAVPIYYQPCPIYYQPCCSPFARLQGQVQPSHSPKNPT